MIYTYWSAIRQSSIKIKIKRSLYNASVINCAHCLPHPFLSKAVMGRGEGESRFAWWRDLLQQGCWVILQFWKKIPVHFKSNFKIGKFYANAWHATNVLWIYFNNVSEPLRALFDVWWKPLAHQKLDFNVLHKLLVFGQIYYQRWKCHCPNSGNTTKIAPMLLREAPIKNIRPTPHTLAVRQNWLRNLKNNCWLNIKRNVQF